MVRVAGFSGFFRDRVGEVGCSCADEGRHWLRLLGLWALGFGLLGFGLRVLCAVVVGSFRHGCVFFCLDWSLLLGFIFRPTDGDEVPVLVDAEAAGRVLCHAVQSQVLRCCYGLRFEMYLC